MPKKNVQNYDNTLIGSYIRQIENPDSIGWDVEKGVWTAPNLSGYDYRNRGMGVDILNNAEAKEIASSREGQYLTEQEERDLRNAHIDYSLGVLGRMNDTIPGMEDISAQKQAEAVGLIYRGDANVLKDRNSKVGKAYRSTNDKDFHNAVGDYYESKGLTERAKNHRASTEKHSNNYSLPDIPAPDMRIIERPDATRVNRLEYQPSYKYTPKPMHPIKKNFWTEWGKMPYKSEGGPLESPKAWDSLSMREKSEMMRVAIENGITTLPEIRKAYNEFALGGNLFSGEEDHSSQMDQGYVYDVLPKMLKEAGLDVRVTSGYRRPGQAGTAGSRSWHTHHGAVDIVPQGKTTFEDIENALYNNPVISRYMIDNGFGLIDETGRTAESRATMKKTGATGAHFHIGKDSKAVSAYNNRMSSIWDNNMNQLEAAINQPTLPAFMPSNPQAFFAPLESYQRPVVVEEPLVQAAMENSYSPEQLEKEERAQGLRNLGLAMSIMRGGQEQSYSPLWSAVSMLSGNQMAKGGKIHIKPENRGKFTALKKRTGHSATWFKQHGTPAQKKMATFALNSRKWKHGLGGNLFSGEDTPTQQMNNGLNLYRRTNNLGETEYIYQETPDSEEILLTPTNKRFSDDPTNWDYKDASGREYSPRMASPTSSSTLEASEKMGPLEKYVAELNWRTKNDPASIALQGKYTMPAIAAAPFLTWAGEATYPYLSAALANPYVDAGLTSAFAGHGLNHAINEGIDDWGDAAMTALEVTPLGRMAKPIWNAAKSTRNFIPTLDSNMSGIRYAYNRNPELANIGTLEEYNDYLKTVFPESKVRDINYHMGPRGLQELKPSTGEVYNTNPDARGIYVTPDKSYAQKLRKYTTARLEKPSLLTYLKRNLTPGGWNKANDAFTDIYPVMIDARNPLLTKGTWTWGIKDKKYQSLMEDYDAIVNSGPKWYQNFNSMPESIVPRTEQSLILGSDADVAGFKRFMSKPQITPENAASDIRYFKDDFGKEVPITPYPGTDTQLIDATNKGHLAALRHQFSQDKTEQLKSVMGWDDAAIAEYQDEILRSFGDAADIQVKGTNTGFKKIGNHKGEISQNGESVSHSMTLNRDRIPDDATAMEAGIHEMGVHGRTLHINPSETEVEGSYSNTVAQKFPRIAEVMKKNQEIAKQTLIPNDKGKLFQQIKKSSDLERWLYENNVPAEQWEKYFNDWKYYKYVTEDQELLARGYTGQVYETIDPSRETLNIQQLKKFFTPESTEKYKKAVLSVFPFLFARYGLSQENK